MLDCFACGKSYYPIEARHVEMHLCPGCADFYKGMRLTTDSHGIWAFVPAFELTPEEQSDFNALKKRVPHYFDLRLNIPEEVLKDLGFLVCLMEKITKNVA